MKRTTAKLTAIAVKDSFTKAGGKAGASTVEPKTIPGSPPRVAQNTARHSTGIRATIMVRLAAPIPTLWIARENTLASAGGISRS